MLRLLRPITLYAATRLGIARRAPPIAAASLPSGRRFDEQDVGAEVAEHHRAERPGREAREVENLDAFESEHVSSLRAISVCVRW